MKKIVAVLLILAVLLVGCASGDAETAVNESLIVGEKTYSVADLEALPVTEAVFNEVTYKGVTVTALVEDAGYTLADLRAVKAVASDGYAVNYDLPQIDKADVIVAYALADGPLRPRRRRGPRPLTVDDGTFRMVLPEEEGKLNVRMLAEVQVVQ